MDIKQVIILIDEISKEREVPNNVRISLQEAVDILKDSKSEQERISSVISILDEASNDPNVSPHIRTRMWNLVSYLEEMMKS